MPAPPPRPAARPGASGTTIAIDSRERRASGTRVTGAERRARGDVEAFSQHAAGNPGRERRWRGRAVFGSNG